MVCHTDVMNFEEIPNATDEALAAAIADLDEMYRTGDDETCGHIGVKRMTVRNEITRRAKVKRETTEPKVEGRPEFGKVYSLTGGPGVKAISNGNSWAESEVKA